MMLSQLIAKNVKLPEIEGPNLSSSSFDIRMKVIRSTKVIVGPELWRQDPYENQAMAEGPPDDITMQLDKKSAKQYKQYTKLPFHLMFLETPEGGLLVEKNSKDDGFSVQTILPGGLLAPMKVSFPENLIDDLDRLHCSALMHPIHFRALGFKAVTVFLLQAVKVLQVLLFMNATNVVQHRYLPTKKENSMVQKPLLPFYEYRVIDVFREKKEYKSLQEIFDYSNENSASIQRRAHMVRGHFKSLHGKLHWWNPFMRCRKNVEEVGYIKKEYNLITEEKEL